MKTRAAFIYLLSLFLVWDCPHFYDFIALFELISSISFGHHLKINTIKQFKIENGRQLKAYACVYFLLKSLHYLRIMWNPLILQICGCRYIWMPCEIQVEQFNLLISHHPFGKVVQMGRISACSCISKVIQSVFKKIKQLFAFGPIHWLNTPTACCSLLYIQQTWRHFFPPFF